MIYKICPVCDHKLNSMNYCSNCRRLVRKPLTINVDYYLNERHPAEWHACTYHDFPETSVPADYPRQPRQSVSPAASGPVNQPVRRATASQTAPRPADRRPSKRQSSGHLTAAAIILIAAILIFYISNLLIWLPDSTGNRSSFVPDSVTESSWEPAMEEPESAIPNPLISCIGRGQLVLTQKQPL